MEVDHPKHSNKSCYFVAFKYFKLCCRERCIFTNKLLYVTHIKCQYIMHMHHNPITDTEAIIEKKCVFFFLQIL